MAAATGAKQYVELGHDNRRGETLLQSGRVYR